MSAEREKFDELQKMLALKRHEQPPTQFFHKLSDNVVERLRSGETASEPTWRQKLGLDFDSKPVLVCATGVGVCGLLLLGIIAAQHVDPPASGGISSVGSASLSATSAAFPGAGRPGSGPFAPTANGVGYRRSVDPVVAGQGLGAGAAGLPGDDGTKAGESGAGKRPSN